MNRTYADRPHMPGVAWNVSTATVTLDDGSTLTVPVRDFDRGLYNASGRRRLVLLLPADLGGLTEFWEASTDVYANADGERVTVLSMHFV